MENKTFGAFEVKSESKGEVRAVVATLDQVDLDKDVILAGAIKDGAKVRLSGYGHDTLTAGAAPVGIGTLTVLRNEAVLDGRFFLNVERGRESFETVKALGDAGEWSIGFAIERTVPVTEAWRAKGAERLLAAIDVFEVSAVLRGAQQTRTLAAKHASLGVADLAELAAIGAKVKRGAMGRPLPERFWPAVLFAREQYTLPDHIRPVVRLVAPGDLREGTCGKCFGDVVHISSELPDEEIVKTIFHEFAHVYEHARSWVPDEGFCYLMERQLYDSWRTDALASIYTEM